MAKSEGDLQGVIKAWAAQFAQKQAHSAADVHNALMDLCSELRVQPHQLPFHLRDLCIQAKRRAEDKGSGYTFTALMEVVRRTCSDIAAESS